MNDSDLLWYIGSRKYSYIDIFMYIYFYVYVLHKTFKNFISTLTIYDYRGDINKIWNQSKNVYRSYRIFIANVHFARISKVYGYSVIQLN